MRRFRLLPILAAATLLAGCSAPSAPGPATAPTSPYAGFADADLRSLTPEQAETLRTGGGGGYALAAELNGYAGPKHVLDLAQDLGLSEEQLARTQANRADVDAKARAQGTVVLGLYHKLDEGFRNGTADGAWLEQVNRDIGIEEGKLRAIHLAAHLELAEVLTEHQQMRYRELRGYGAGGGGHAHTGDGHGH